MSFLARLAGWLAFGDFVSGFDAFSLPQSRQTFFVLAPGLAGERTRVSLLYVTVE